MHIDVAIVLFCEFVSPMMQVYFEAGPGSCKAKDLARQARSKNVAMEVEGMQAMINAGELDQAAEIMVNSGGFLERMCLQQSFKAICEELRCGVPQLLCAHACLHTAAGAPECPCMPLEVCAPKRR